MISCRKVAVGLAFLLVSYTVIVNSISDSPLGNTTEYLPEPTASPSSSRLPSTKKVRESLSSPIEDLLTIREKCPVAPSASMLTSCVKQSKTMKLGSNLYRLFNICLTQHGFMEMLGEYPTIPWGTMRLPLYNELGLPVHLPIATFHEQRCHQWEDHPVWLHPISGHVANLMHAMLKVGSTMSAPGFEEMHELIFQLSDHFPPDRIGFYRHFGPVMARGCSSVHTYSSSRRPLAPNNGATSRCFRNLTVGWGNDDWKGSLLNFSTLVRELRHFLALPKPESNAAWRLVMIIRRPAHGRFVRNHNKVQSVLESVLLPEGISSNNTVQIEFNNASVRDQAMAFSRSRQVLFAVHGAALAWTYLLQPGDVLIEICPIERFGTPNCRWFRSLLPSGVRYMQYSPDASEVLCYNKRNLSLVLNLEWLQMCLKSFFPLKKNVSEFCCWKGKGCPLGFGIFSNKDRFCSKTWKFRDKLVESEKQ